MALENITAELISNGQKPVWTWPEYGTSLNDPEWLSTKWSTQPMRADIDQKHMHAMNHLRFYLPYMQRFKKIEKNFKKIKTLEQK